MSLDEGELWIRCLPSSALGSFAPLLRFMLLLWRSRVVTAELCLAKRDAVTFDISLGGASGEVFFRLLDLDIVAPFEVGLFAEY